MILSTSGLDYETIRKLVLDVLKEGNFSQYGDIKNQVANKLVEYGYSTESNSFSLSYSPNYRELSNQDSDKVNQVVWDLIIDRVLTIGLNKSNENWPFLRLTDYGKNIINETDNVIVYDIDGMLQLLKEKIPMVDDIIVKYFIECLNTFKISTMLASSVMLGCAAERAILLLYDSYKEWILNKYSEREYNNLEALKNKNISKKFEEMIKSIKGHKSDIEESLFDNFDILVTSIFTIIRKNRNDAGHPIADKEINRDELRAMIYVFINHCRKVYDFIEYFDKSRDEN